MNNYMPFERNIAKKYAKAFMNVFPKSCTLTDIINIEIAQKFLQKNKKTLFFLQLLQFDAARKESMIADLVGHFALPQICIQLFRLLVHHNRSFYIPDVLWFIAELYKEQTNSVEFSIKSAHSLDSQQIESIKRFLAIHVKKNIIATTALDTSLIAGLRLQSNNNLWEYSVRKQLHTLRALKQ